MRPLFTGSLYHRIAWYTVFGFGLSVLRSDNFTLPTFSDSEMARPATPLPFHLPLQDNDSDFPWYWQSTGGGFKVNFGKHRDTEIHNLSLSYLHFCRHSEGLSTSRFVSGVRDYMHACCTNFLQQKLFRDAFDVFYNGLHDMIEKCYGEFIVPFGTKHRGQKVCKVRDKEWLMWAQTKPKLVSKVCPKTH